MIKRNCPICETNNSKTLFDKEIRTYDGYKSFTKVNVSICNNCDFIFNADIIEKQDIDNFYINESPYQSITSGGSGALNESDIKRYETYEKMFKNVVNKDSIIGDIGCGKGGFVTYLNSLRYKNVQGIEISTESIEYCLENNIKVEKGSADDIPLFEQNKKYDLLFCSNIIEHLYDLEQVTTSFNNVLSQNGNVFIDVPDVSLYLTDNIFPFYWFLHAREHLNHFSDYHLIKLFQKNTELKCIKKENYITKIGNSSSIGLLMLLSKTTNQQKIVEKEDNENKIIEYIKNGELQIKKYNDQIEHYVASQEPIFCWGISSEFFICASTTDLLKCNIKGLFDRDTHKHALSFNNIKINSSENLKTLGGGYNCFYIFCYE